MTGAEPLTSFCREVEEFFQDHAVPRTGPAASEAGAASDLIPIFSHEASAADPVAELAAARAWRALLADAGYGWIEGPREYGGAGLTREHAKAFAIIQSRFVTPPQDQFMVGLRIVGPAILGYGREELRQLYLRRLYRGDVLACQLFSEPGAGSDLASLRTKAVRSGDYWRIDGAKVWTSQAQLCDIGMLLARSEPDEPKHRGLTAFIVDMRDPAIEVRPLRQMNGSEHFNEVFITGLHVHDRFRVGEQGAGWSATVSTLNNERAATGDRASADRELVRRMLAVARERPAAGDPRLLRELIGRTVSTASAVEFLNRRFDAEYEHSGGAGARNSVTKLARNRMLQQMMDVALHVLGEAAIADTGEPSTFAWGQAMLSVPGQRIAGGTDEIQKNILAERVLGLPLEPRPDRLERRAGR